MDSSSQIINTKMFDFIRTIYAADYPISMISHYTTTNLISCHLLTCLGCTWTYANVDMYTHTHMHNLFDVSRIFLILCIYLSSIQPYWIVLVVTSSFSIGWKRTPGNFASHFDCTRSYLYLNLKQDRVLSM